MVLPVPFDGSELSWRAVERATEFGELTGEEVTVLTVVTPDESVAVVGQPASTAATGSGVSRLSARLARAEGRPRRAVPRPVPTSC